MTKELDKKLCAKYPKIFAQRNLPMNQTAMCWGFDVGDGWYWLIDQLCDRIQSYLDNNPHLKIPQVEAVQVKEKFAGLRFYINGGDDDIYGAISLAEHMSYNICEVCGSTKDIGCTQGWLMTICKSCFDSAEPRIKDRGWKANKE
jgi:hypothetical protein